MPRVTFIGGTNVVMRGTESEDRQFVYCPNENVPFILDVTGITPPTPKYYISRERCDHFILAYIVKGKGVLQFGDDVYELNPHDTVILTPKSRHIYYSDPDEPFEFVWANFFCDYMDGFLSGIGLRDTPVVHGVDCEAQFREIVRITKASPNNNDICFPVMRLVHEILITLSEKVYFEKHKHIYSQLGHTIKDMLDESLYGKTDIGDIASALYVSKSSVYREFQRYYGMSPYRYVLNQKIEIAKSMLVRTSYTVAEIAAILNFTDQFYFSNLFKKKTGLSPNSYRKNASKTPPPPLQNQLLRRRKRGCRGRLGGINAKGKPTRNPRGFSDSSL